MATENNRQVRSPSSNMSDRIVTRADSLTKIGLQQITISQVFLVT